MENHKEDKLNNLLLIASVILNVALIFLSFQKKRNIEEGGIEQAVIAEKEQWNSKVLLAHQHNGQILNMDLLLINGADSFYLGKLMQDKGEQLLMISGFKSCATCLYQELDRLKASSLQEKLMVIAMRGLEDEFYYFWKQNKLKTPLYFANLELLGVNPNGHSKPFYFVTDSTLKVSDLLLTESNDDTDFVNRCWQNVQQRQKLIKQEKN